MEAAIIIESATAYAKLGWYVLPVLDKVPQGNAWQEHATIESVEELFCRFKFDGVGVLLGAKSGIVDIECDSEEAEETLLELLNGEIPFTATFQSTHSKHYLFQWREGLPDKAVFKLRGLEFRIGNAGAAQSVFPPSNGRKWEIESTIPVSEFPAWDAVLKQYADNQKPKKFKAVSGGFTPHYGDGETLNVPRWLAKHGREIIHRDNGKDGATRWFIECPNINRHTTKNAIRDCLISQEASGKLGGHCFHQSCGMNSWDALRSTIGELEYEDYHEVPTEEADIDLSQFMVEPKVEIKVEPVIFEKESTLPEICREVPGLIGDIVKHTLSTSRYPQPDLALAGAIALMATITGRKVQDEGGARTNLYVMGLCEAAAGKEKARETNKIILANSGATNMIGPESIGSSAGLINVINETPSCLFQLDEIGKLLVMSQNPKAGHLYKIGSELLKLYSSSSSQFISDALAKLSDIKRIDQPHACIYGTSTPEMFWQSLTATNVREGLVGRFLVFDSSGYVAPVWCKPSGIPDDIIERVKWWLSYCPNGGMFSNPTATVVPYGLGARERIETHYQDIHWRRKKEDSTRAAIWSRSGEKAAKLAILFACSRANCSEPKEIDLIDVNRGIALANSLTKQMIRKIVDHVSDGENEAITKKVLRLIPTGQDHAVTRSQLTKLTWFLRDNRQRNEIVNLLLDSGDIVQSSIASSGTKPATHYWRVQ